MRNALLLPIAVLFLLGTTSAQLMLTTTFTGGNGQSGNMFDIRALAPVIIQSFDVNLDNGTWSVAVYAVTSGGSHVGVQQSPTAWTQLATTTVSSNGTNNPTPLNLTLNRLIPGGAQQGFYVTVTSGSGINYTNGSSVGAVAAQDTFMQILVGTGNAYPFSTVFQPRIWNGTVRYTPGAGLFPEFSGSPTTGNVPLTVNFTDQSFSSAPGGITLYEWDFNGDAVIDSNATNPSHVYTTPGTYTVSLTVHDGMHPSATRTRMNYIQVDPQLLLATTSGPGVGDVMISGPANPPGTTEGFLLVSSVLPFTPGTGPIFGLAPDSTIFLILSLPPITGGVFHYLPSPNTFPNVPFSAPPGTVILPPGTALDCVLVQIHSAGLQVSNVSRVTF